MVEKCRAPDINLLMSTWLSHSLLIVEVRPMAVFGPTDIFGSYPFMLNLDQWIVRTFHYIAICHGATFDSSTSYNLQIVPPFPKLSVCSNEARRILIYRVFECNTLCVASSPFIFLWQIVDNHNNHEKSRFIFLTWAPLEHTRKNQSIFGYSIPI